MTSNRPIADTDGTYLGATSWVLKTRNTAQILIGAKNALLMKYFKNIEVSRPSLESCDANSPESVYVFLARENLECAVSCDPSTSLERAREICRIISGEFVTGEYLHLEIHPNYSKGLEKYKDSLPESRAHEMLAYFDVWLKESPQDTEEHEAILSLVQRYIQLAQRILW